MPNKIGKYTPAASGIFMALDKVRQPILFLIVCLLFCVPYSVGMSLFTFLLPMRA